MLLSEDDDKKDPDTKGSTWYNGLLAKIALEIVSALMMWVFYIVVRKLLPKRYRLKDKTIKTIIKDFSAISETMVSKSDDLPTIFEKAKNLFDYFYEKKNLVDNTEQEFKVFINDIDENVEIQRNWAFITLIFPKILHLAKKTKLQQEMDSTTGIQEFVFSTAEDNLATFYVVETYQAFAEERVFEPYFACTKGFNCMSLLDLLFESFDNKIYIHTSSDRKIKCSRLEQDTCQTDYILDEQLFNETIKEITSFKALGQQRSILLTGLPGCGKTSFCLELSKRVSGKILKIDSGVFIKLSASSVKTLIESLNVDFIIVDDIDRIKTNDVPSFLYCLEAVKGYDRKPTLLATCNNIKSMDMAIIRPGRFDDIIEFTLPSSKERERFISTLIQKIGGVSELTKEQMAIFVEETAGMTNAYLKEYVNQFKVEPDFKTLIRKIKSRKKYLKDVSTEDLDAYEDSLLTRNIPQDDDDC